MPEGTAWRVPGVLVELQRVWRVQVLAECRHHCGACSRRPRCLLDTLRWLATMDRGGMFVGQFV